MWQYGDYQQKIMSSVSLVGPMQTHKKAPVRACNHLGFRLQSVPGATPRDGG